MLIYWAGSLFRNINVRSNYIELTHFVLYGTYRIAFNAELGGYSLDDAEVLYDTRIRMSGNLGNFTPYVGFKKDECVYVDPSNYYSSAPTTDTIFRVKNNCFSKESHSFEVRGDSSIVTDYIIMRSSTAGSTKKFKITVDDTGTLSATEVTE